MAGSELSFTEITEYNLLVYYKLMLIYSMKSVLHIVQMDLIIVFVWRLWNVQFYFTTRVFGRSLAADFSILGRHKYMYEFLHIYIQILSKPVEGSEDSRQVCVCVYIKV